MVLEPSEEMLLWYVIDWQKVRFSPGRRVPVTLSEVTLVRARPLNVPFFVLPIPPLTEVFQLLPLGGLKEVSSVRSMKCSKVILNLPSLFVTFPLSPLELVVPV